jgi:hypothetical protein
VCTNYDINQLFVPKTSIAGISWLAAIETMNPVDGI